MESLKNDNVENIAAANMNAASNAIPFLSVVETDILTAVNSKRIYDVFKRVFDLVFALIALVILSPIMLLIALVIYIDDPGNPFYISSRCGKDGQLFQFIKFRSMHINADAELDDLRDKNEMEGPVFKIKEDPRITRVGKYIRRTSIDELPQLLNVIKGDMSIVGPRPPLPNEVEQYSSYQMHRLSVRPGLTCNWQVQPSRNSISFDRWVELDIRYILERSFVLDLKLIFKTVGVMIKREGE